MAVFGAPVAFEDHAVRACLAALGIQEEIARLASDVRVRDGVDLALRVGLNSGRVIAGEVGSKSLGYTTIGLTKAQREPVIQPHTVGDDLRRVPGVPCTTTMQRSRPPILAATRQLTNLTVPRRPLAPR